MRDILPDLTHWRENAKPIALATVLQTWGSAPRGVGAKMALTLDGKMAGSVSGGCVEGAVFEAGVEVLKTGLPQLLHFGVADETAWEVGLACGGNIEIFVKPLVPTFFDAIRANLDQNRSSAMVTVIDGPKNDLGRELLVSEGGEFIGSLSHDLDEEAITVAREALAEERSQRITLKREGEEPREIFVEVMLPPPTLVMVGGVHIAIALTAIAKALGYRTVVVDPRRTFGSATRFPDVDQLIQSWPEEAFAQIDPNRSTAVAMLTHDPKIDDPALQIVLNSPAFYVGALGSRTTQANRRKRLVDAGLTEAQLSRLHGPIGLDIGGRTPEEIALAIMAQVVVARNSAI